MQVYPEHQRNRFPFQYLSAKGACLIIACLLLFSCSCGQSSVRISEHPNSGMMVVSAHPEASSAGKEVLLKGGNAVDAAVTVQFSLAVCAPFAGNIGGGGFLVWRDSSGNAATLDFRECAPRASTTNMYLDANGNVIPGLSTSGRLACGVPGSVAGMWAAHQKYGVLPWAELLAPAIRIAEKGYAITALQAKEMNDEQANFRLHNPDTNACSFIRLKAWKAGDTLKQPALAATLRRIQDQGRDGFYKGETAELIVAEMQRGKGLISAEDLEKYEAKWREPLRGNFREYAVITMGPPSGGGFTLLQMLGMASYFPLKEWGPDSVLSYHLMAEIMRRAYADRAYFGADPDFEKVPLKNLLDPAYLSRRISYFDPSKAGSSSQIVHGTFPKESEETTHFSIVDASGNAVSVTTTLNSWYGSKVMVSGAGFLLNNEMDDFASKPGAPNQFGLVGSEANRIMPGKRMTSSMAPFIMEKQGKLFLVCGTPGGMTIPNQLFRLIIEVTQWNTSLQQAIDKKRFSQQWLPDKIFIEEGAFPAKIKEGLERRGHTVEKRNAFGRIDGILIHEDGSLEGGSDKRGDDAAK